MNVPINRWTLAAAIALAAYLGSDFVEALVRVVGVLAMPYVPAA